jgi:uncharacterized protein (TIGR03435 family)
LPEWAKTETFDITARGKAASMDETNAMLRTLLRDRFSLRMHQQQQMEPAFVVTRVNPGQLGPHLKPSSNDCPPKPWCTGHLTAGNNVGTGVKWEYLLDRIRAAVGRPLVDRTGLSGNFDFELMWTPGLTTTPDAGLDIFQALHDQLGLKLESGQGPTTVWMIDQVERPSSD